MAELPDLTVFADILSRKFAGQTVKEVTITESRKLNVSADKLKTTLEGKKLESVTREGKTLQFHFADGDVLGLHLMLRGELVDLEADETPRFQVMAMRFSNDKGFAVVDLQKQATLTLQPPPVSVPDALAMDGEYFADLLSKKRTSIKTLLMDQKLVRGIGNSYADEILYHAGISPFSVAQSIPLNRVSKLYKSIADVLNKAIKQIAEANSDELRGELKDFMAVHSPKLKATEKGEAIKTEKIGGRTTYYTDAQELYI